MNGTTVQRRLTFGDIFKYVKRVKRTLNDKDKFSWFVRVLEDRVAKRVDTAYLVRRLKRIFKGHPHLILGYNNIVAKKYQIPPDDAPKLAKRLNPNDGNVIFRNIQGGRDDRVLRDKKCVQPRREHTKSSQEAVGQKSIRELDLSNSKSCTPSYKLLPKNYTLPSVSWRTDDDAAVLNDRCISVRPGKFKTRKINPYEDKIFHCEDDRFELDMLLELFKSTRVRVQELLTKILNNDIDTDHPFRIEDYLTVQNIRCIEKLHGGHWLHVLDELHNKAPRFLLGMQHHLKQKQDELENSHSVYDKEWAQILANNYHKSLDHRSWNLKQQDKWSLSTKALVAEIKKICVKQKQLQDEDVESIVPHMEFEFPDADIHEDLYQLVKYSCEKSCSSKHADKFMKIWTTFLEPALGLPRRPQGPAAAPVQLLDVSDEIGLVENLGDDLQAYICTETLPYSNETMPQGTGALHTIEQSTIHLKGEITEGELPRYRHTPLELHDVDKNGLIFYGNGPFYVLFRLHQVLYERIQKVKSHSSSTENGLKVSNDTNPTDSYGRLMGAIYGHLDGTSNNDTFEDECRSIIGTQLYLVCTLKELIDKVVGQLRKISSDKAEMRLIECHEYEKSRNAATFTDEVYSANARFMLPGDNIYRIECIPHSSTPTRLTIQLLMPEDSFI